MYKLLSGLLAGAALLVAAPSTLAAPVTVDLRIEGPSRTLFEGPVTTDVRTFHFTGDDAAPLRRDRREPARARRRCPRAAQR